MSKIRKQIDLYAHDNDKKILHCLFDHYHYQSEWNFVAKGSYKRLTNGNYQCVWEPTDAGRILYAHHSKESDNL